MPIRQKFVFSKVKEKPKATKQTKMRNLNEFSEVHKEHIIFPRLGVLCLNLEGHMTFFFCSRSKWIEEKRK